MNYKLLLLGFLSLGFARISAQTFPLQVKDEKLTYVTDERGNRILDYSSCGYHNSEQPIPDVANAVFVSWQPGDNSSRIQRAIDYVSSLALDKNGFRGAVLLDKGTFELNESLRISVSGVVLRGSDREQTVLLKKGVDRGALLYIEGRNDLAVTDTLDVLTSYVPVNTCTFQVTNNVQLVSGERVRIVRPSTKEWIASVGCDIFGGGISALGWKEGEMDLVWDRSVSKADGNQLTLDAPLTMALDNKWGTVKVLRYSWPGRIAEAGLENLTLASDYNKKYPKDEDHCWTGVSIENAENCWVRRVNFKHFAGSAVIIQRTGSKTTVEDCVSTEPVSEIGGMRRSTFYTMGQQTLFQRCYSKQGIHDFSAGFCAAGPNAFVQCDSEESLGFSGSIDSWACGLLFDVVNIDGHDLVFKNLGQDKNGVGWNTGNSLFWQCTAAGIECYSPARDAVNRAYGCWAQFSGDGQWAESNNHVHPRSLFYAQLAARLNKDCSDQARILPRATNATSSPTVEAAMEMAKEAYTPRLTMQKWIEEAPYTASVSSGKLKSLEDLKFKTPIYKEKEDHLFAIINGRMQVDGRLLVGGRQEVPWWNGKLRTSFLSKAKPHITRFVPGREGLGLTDRIDSTVNYMVKNQILVLDHNYGLWYERRRNDHERNMHADAEVWAPFNEMPYSRSGQGEAQDRLSKYDLNKFNPWYWNRLKRFVDVADRDGLVLLHDHYNQHNIIEEGAHWCDYPWRSANNINQLGFAEKTVFSGDKRVYMAEQFYDITRPVIREYHSKFIRQSVNVFHDNNGVVHSIGLEYTGPLNFMNFWLEEVNACDNHQLVALTATKDVQDSVLKDKKHTLMVDVIDIRQWHYRADGTLYEPQGGVSLALRQHARLIDPGTVSCASVYRAVREYRCKYPDKAVVYNGSTIRVPRNAMNWAIFMAGGSFAKIPPIDELPVYEKASSFSPIDRQTDMDTQWVMGAVGKGYLGYCVKNEINLDLMGDRETYKVFWIDPDKGTVIKEDGSVRGGGKVILKAPAESSICFLQL